MSDPIQQQLLGHILDALDDDEYERVDALIEHNPEYSGALVAWRRRLAPLAKMRPEFEPPPGLAERTCRFVASCVPTLAGLRQRMTPCFAPPLNLHGWGRPDVATLVFLLAAAVSIMFPAISNSRLQTRLATCQEGLRQFGLALNQCGQQQGAPLRQLANNGQLTPAGLRAVAMLQNSFFHDSRRETCPEAWLAAQGIRRIEPLPDRGTPLPIRYAVFRSPPTVPCCKFQSDTPAETLPELQATLQQSETPLLADAPIENLPTISHAANDCVHDGRGRNLLFEDGHADFLPTVASRSISDSSSVESSALTLVSLPHP